MIVKRFVQCHVFASHRQVGTEMKNIQPTMDPDLCKNDPLLVLFGSNGNS
jgi:hypothetical protein